VPSVFPGALDNIASNKLNSTVSATDHPDHHNLLADAVNAIEATLGAGLSNIVTSVGATAPITSTGGSTPTIGVTAAALTGVDDTNVTLTLGGSPSTALLAATSLTLGWTGQLSPARGGTGVNNGTNTLTIGPSAYVSGTNSGDVTLLTNSGLRLDPNQVLYMGTPSIITRTSTNLVTGTTHTHEIQKEVRLLGQGTAENQIPITGATPFTPNWAVLTDTASVDFTVSGGTITAAVLPAGVDHNGLANLTTGDPHTQYAFLAGRVGNQTLIGGTAASGTLTLQSTSNATRGNILFGTSAYDEVNNRLGIGLVAPATTIHARSAAFASIRAETTAANNYAQFDLVSPSRRYSMGIGGASVTDGVADDWYLYDGTAAAYRLVVDSSGRFGIGTTSPRGPLDVVANAPSVFQRDNAAVAAIHSYYNANTTDNNGINWTFYGDTTGTGASALQIFGQWDLRLDVHDHATRSSSALFRNYVNGASNIWLWGSSNGNVGISTATAPSFSLSFGNAASRTISIENTAAGTAGRNLTIAAGSTVAGGSNTVGSALGLNAGRGTGSGASNIIFQTGATTAVATDLQLLTERMRINNTGDVGIGTTIPTGQARLALDKDITPSLTGVVNGFVADIGVTGHSSGGTDARTFNLLMTVTGANNITSQWGSFVNVSNNLDATKTVTNQYAYGASPRIIGAGATTALGGYFVTPFFPATATGNVSNYYAYLSGSVSYTAGATSTITNAYGIYLNALDAAFVTNAWGVYQVGASDTNYFNASVGIGTTSVTDKLTVNGVARVYGAAYTEGTTNPGVYMGSPSSGNPRVMWADGTGNNWQIDVTSNLMRWIVPGYNMMRLQDSGGFSAQLSLWQTNSLFTTFDINGITFEGGMAPAGGFVIQTTSNPGADGVDFTVKAGPGASGISNTFGGTLYLDAGRGTGSGISNLVFRTGASTGTATALQTLTNRLTINNAGDFTFFDGADFILGTTTGTKIGTATTQKIGFYNATPIVRPSAYTQTYSTADKTVAAQTAAALTNNTGGTVSTTLAAITAGAIYTQADMLAVKNALASLADQFNKLRNDHLDTTNAVNAIIDDLQALGLVG
jgi:hypothetical protein